MDGNLLTAGEPTNLPAIIEAVYEFDGSIQSNRIEVWIIPEPVTALAALVMAAVAHGRRRE
jgi:hypothetical protein